MLELKKTNKLDEDLYANIKTKYELEFAKEEEELYKNQFDDSWIIFYSESGSIKRLSFKNYEEEKARSKYDSISSKGKILCQLGEIVEKSEGKDKEVDI